MPVLWDQHRSLECSGCDHSGAVSHQPEVGSSLDFPIGLMFLWPEASFLPNLTPHTALVFLESMSPGQTIFLSKIVTAGPWQAGLDKMSEGQEPRDKNKVSQDKGDEWIKPCVSPSPHGS